MRETILKRFAKWHADYPWRMLIVVTLITIILMSFAAQLTVTMRTQDLMPEGDPKVDQFNQIIDEFASATSIIVVVQGEEDSIKAFADDLAPRILTLIDTSENTENSMKLELLRDKIEKVREQGNNESELAQIRSEIEELEKRINFKLFQRVDYKVETNFLRNHALMMVKAEDLQNTKNMFTDPNLAGLLTNINNSMEKEYVGQEESLSTREKEDGAINFLDGIQHLVLALYRASSGIDFVQEDASKVADELLLGEPYFLSYDKKALILNVIPNFTIMDRDLLMVGAESMQSLVDEVLKDYKGVRAGLSGDIAREHDEQIHSTQTLSYTTVIALIAILILLIISFRMVVAPVLTIINLSIGLIWAMGVAFIVAGELNMMTAMLSVVFLGLGIDFAIHLVSGFTEWRAAGDSIAMAMEKTFLKSGKGIITGALTTSFAFLALLVSQSRGMKQMGLVAGSGLLTILLTTLLFLPIMLVFRERLIDRRRQLKGVQKVVKRDISFQSLGKVSTWLGKHYTLTLIASLLISAFLIWSALQIEYDKNYLRMEPKGLTSIALQDTIIKKFDLSMEYALCLADGVDESRHLAENYRDLGMVAMTNDISLYLPSRAEQKKRIPHLIEIKEQMSSASARSIVRSNEFAIIKEEVKRLEMNVMEMQDMAFLGGQDKVDNKCKEIVGDPDDSNSNNIIRDLIQILETDNPRTLKGLSLFQKSFAPYFQKNVINMCSTQAIKLNDLPLSVLDRFSNRSRDKFMITIYPAGQLAVNADVMERFVEDVERVSEKTTGGPPVMVAWIRIAARDGRNAILLTILIVFIFLWIDFRRPWYALMAMIPLALGAFWMVGLMHISGMMLSFMTLAGIPLIIGIGIDDGVHIMHRWQHEGRGKIKIIFSSTGKAIMLTSLTTMLAFGSFVFSVFPGWAWFGESLFIGVGACFLTTVIILPGIIGFIERKGKG